MERDQDARPILLKIHTTMKDGQEEPQVIELMTEGTCGVRNGHLFIMYEETEVSGMKGSKTTLKAEPGKIELVRFGEVATRMEFKKGDTFMSSYETPYGVFDIVVSTLKAEVHSNETEGQILLSYNLEINGNGTQYCEMNIRFQFKNS